MIGQRHPQTFRREQDQGERISGLPDRPERMATLVPIASATAAGAALGVLSGGGILGFVVGAILGGGAGAVVGHVARDRDRRFTERDSLLDREIGVTEGDLGAAQYESRPSWGGSFSAASAGATISSAAPAAGPIPR